jgi:hypothetical protein
MKLLSRALLVFVILLAQKPAFPQVAAPLTTGRVQLSDANGTPLAGGFIYTCVAGAACPGTPLDSYSDAIGTLNLNPIVLDAAGAATLFATNSALSRSDASFGWS